MVKFYLHNLNQEKRITNTVKTCLGKNCQTEIDFSVISHFYAFNSFTLLLSEILPIFSNGVYVLV